MRRFLLAGAVLATLGGIAFGQQILTAPFQATVSAPSQAVNAGITPVRTGVVSTVFLLKTSAGNLYSITAVNQGSTAGLLEVFDSATVPADGAVTPALCVTLPANSTANINYSPGPPGVFASGITAAASSSTTCFTKTTGLISAFFFGAAQ